MAAADPPPPEMPGPDAAGASPPPPFAVPWPMLGAAAGGGVIVLIILLLGGTGNRDAGPQTARLEQLDATVRALASRAPPAAADPNMIASLTQRLAKLEEASSAPRPPGVDPNALASLTQRLAKLEAANSTPRPPVSDPALAGRLAAADKSIATLTGELVALRQRSDAAAAAAEAAQRRADAAARAAETARTAGAQDVVVDRQDMAVLGNRLTALEQTAKALQADLAQQRSNLAKQSDTRADGRSVRLAVVAEMLKTAVARGERFRDELDAAKALAPDQAALAPLEAFADAGVPTAAVLAQQLRAALPAMLRAAEPKAAADGGFLKRLQVNAERLVRIQPIGEQPGEDAGATLARAEAKAGRGDIAGALQELATLAPAVRAPAQDWIKTAQARNAAIDVSRRFAAAQIAALAGRSD